MNVTRLRWAGGVALLALTASACGMGDDAGSAGGNGDGDGNGHVVYAEFYPPIAAWALETDDSFTLSRAGCLEPLVQYESDGSLGEKLVTTWEQVELTAWEFHLREGVQFQDGTPMDAEAVAGALTHLLESKTPARSFKLRRRGRRGGGGRDGDPDHDQAARRAAPIPDGHPQHRHPRPDGPPVSQDLDEARRLLDEAGVEPSMLSIELMAYNSRPEFGDLATVIQDQLGELGIEVKVKSGEYASLEPDVFAGDYDAFLLSRGYLIDLGDPAGYLAADYTCKGSYNRAHNCDEKTDAAINQALEDEDQEARFQTYAEVAEALQSGAVSVFLVHESAVVGTTARVENFEQHPLNFCALTKDLGVS